MEGYVVNSSPNWVHAMKRHIGPGAKVELSELYNQYGEKYGLKPNEEFLTWLRNVKLKDRSKWRIITGDMIKPVSNDVLDEKFNDGSSGSNVAPIVNTTYTVNDVVGFSVRQAREVLPKIKDVKLLKYALSEANNLAGKDSLCKLIRNRLRELQMVS